MYKRIFFLYNKYVKTQFLANSFADLLSPIFFIFRFILVQTYGLGPY